MKKLARRKSNVCAIIAVGMTVIACSYIICVIFNPGTAESLLTVFAALVVVVSIWNLLVYIERARMIQEQRKERGFNHD